MSRVLSLEFQASSLCRVCDIGLRFNLCTHSDAFQIDLAIPHAVKFRKKQNWPTEPVFIFRHLLLLWETKICHSSKFLPCRWEDKSWMLSGIPRLKSASCWAELLASETYVSQSSSSVNFAKMTGPTSSQIYCIDDRWQWQHFMDPFEHQPKSPCDHHDILFQEQALVSTWEIEAPSCIVQRLKIAYASPCQNAYALRLYKCLSEMARAIV